MAWVAMDRAVKSVQHFGMDGPVERWQQLRQEIHDQVCRDGFDPEIGAFTQYYGSKGLDASLLMIPLVGFLPATDPRVRSTVAAVQQRLMRDGFVLRYIHEEGVDGLPHDEGVFLLCTFWLADNLALLGHHADARRIFERLLTLRNDVGLLSEQYDVDRQRLIGNFPQAFSHVALINTAWNLSRTNGPAPPRCDATEQAPARRGDS
jgi:GH15 family glucan-1,4-alpha-glucosidase